MAKLTVRSLQRTELERLLEWRNNPAIRSMMLSNREIGLQEHLDWFEKASNNDCRALYVGEQQGVDVGFGQLSWDKASRVGDWGFYISPTAAKGTGTRLCAALLDAAFGDIGLVKVCAQVLHFNDKSIAIHRRLGFAQEGLLRSQHWDGANWQDLLCFGILQQEWLDKATGEKIDSHHN